MSTEPLNFCNAYSAIPALKDAASDYDKKQQQFYCEWASKQDLGPIGDYPSNYSVPKRLIQPVRSTLARAYEFSGNVGPTPEDRNYRNQ